MFIRSSAVNAQFFQRGLKLGFQRGELSAAQDSLTLWLKVSIPFVYSRLYNASHFKGSLYYYASTAVIVAQLLAMSAARSATRDRNAVEMEAA